MVKNQLIEREKQRIALYKIYGDSQSNSNIRWEITH